MSRAGKLAAPLLAAALIAGCASNEAKDTPPANPFAGLSTEQIIATGDEAFLAKEYDRAMFVYMQAREVEETADIYYRIGLTKLRLDDESFAFQSFSKAIELDEKHAPSREELGLLMMSLGQPEAATAQLMQAVEIDPGRWRAYNALGVMADVDNRYSDAVAMYKKALDANPRSPMLMNNIGYSYYLAGDLQKATSWLDRAIKTDPTYAPAVKNLALLYARQGWYDEAVAALKKVMEEPQAYNDAGYIAMLNGDMEAATELLTEAIRLSPKYYERAYKNLDQVRMAMEKGTMRNDVEMLTGTSMTDVVFPDSRDKKYMTVLPKALSLREAPDADSEIITYLKTGDKVELVLSQPGWAFVTFLRNDVAVSGWVNDRFLEAIENPNKAEPLAEADNGTMIIME